MGRFDVLKDDITRRATEIADQLGLEIVELKLRPAGNVLNIQVSADLPTGGIGLEECASLNQKLDAVLFGELNLGNNYTLEVSSPGLDRPLVNYRDFRRSIGRELHLFLREAVNGKREVIGHLNGVRESELIFQVKKEEWLIPMEKIEKAKQVII